jgi:hypothetical protein
MFSPPILFSSVTALFSTFFYISKVCFFYFASSDIWLLALFISQSLASCEPNSSLSRGPPIARSSCIPPLRPVFNPIEVLLLKSFLTANKAIDFSKHKTNVALNRLHELNESQTPTEAAWLLQGTRVWGISERMMKHRERTGFIPEGWGRTVVA